MKLRRVKFVWGASRVIRGRWYLGTIGLYDRAEGHREDGLAVSVRGLLACSGIAAVVLYLAATLGLYLVWQQNSYSLLTYTDALLLPFRRPEISKKRGQAYIAEGLEMARAQKWHEALTLLRLGLARNPQDLRARLTLSQYFLLTNQRPFVLRVLQEGLADEYPGRPYLERLFRLAEDAEDYALMVATSRRYLPVLRRDRAEPEYRWLFGRCASALLLARQPAEVLTLIETEAPSDANRELRVMALLALGRAEEALQVLDAWQGLPQANRAAIIRLQVRAYREAGRPADMDRVLEEFRRMSPADPAPRIYAVVQLLMAGRRDDAGRAFDDFVFRFGGDAAHLAALAAPLGEIRDRDFLQRCAAAAAERGFPRETYRVFLIQTCVAEGDWAEAARHLAAYSAEPGREKVSSAPWREWMRRLLEAIQNPPDASQSPLVEFLRQLAWPARVYRETIDTLLRGGRAETARDVVNLALRSYPAAEWLPPLRARAEEMLAGRPATVAAAAPAAGAPVRVGERAFLQRLETFLGESQWEEAGRQIQELLGAQPAPAWLAAREDTIRLAQVRIAQARRDLPAALVAARLFLNGDDKRSNQLLELARGYHLAGHAADAIGLAREIVRRTPAHGGARRALAEWEAPAQPGTGKVAGPVDFRAPLPAAGSAAPEDISAEQLLAQIRTRHAAGDTLGMLSSARVFLNGERARSQQLLDLAGELRAAGDRAAAIALAREVVRRTPTFPPGPRLLKEWENAGGK